jgi:hypothetical protein
MRNNTLVITLGILVVLGIGALFLFFPREAAIVTGSIRRMINPKHADMVRLEYIATNPAVSRGWQTLRTLETPDQCRALLTRNFANDPGLAGRIGALRCVSLRASGEVIEVLETRRIAEGQS